MDPIESNKQLWNGIAPSRRKRFSHVSATKTSEGGTVDWGKQPGKELPHVLTSVPNDMLKGEQGEKTVRDLTELLGEQGTTVLIKTESGDTTGEVLLKVKALSQTGSELLNRGYWMVTGQGDGAVPEARGFFIDKGHTVGTEKIPRYTVRAENSIVIKWAPRNKEGSQVTPNTVYKAIEEQTVKLFQKGIGLSDDSLIDPETGAEADSGATGTVGKQQFAAGWRAAQLGGDSPRPPPPVLHAA